MPTLKRSLEMKSHLLYIILEMVTIVFFGERNWAAGGQR
jgi:hypothetical protein